MTRRTSADDAAIPGLFSIDRFDVGHVTTLERARGVRVVTDPRQWAHAVEFRPQAGADFEDGPLLVDVAVEVESGRVEVGALSTTGSTFLSASTVEAGSHTVALRLPALGRCQSITVRNAGSAAATVRVVSLVTRRDPEPVDAIDGHRPFGAVRRLSPRILG